MMLSSKWSSGKTNVSFSAPCSIFLCFFEAEDILNFLNLRNKRDFSREYLSSSVDFFLSQLPAQLDETIVYNA